MCAWSNTNGIQLEGWVRSKQRKPHPWLKPLQTLPTRMSRPRLSSMFSFHQHSLVPSFSSDESLANWLVEIGRSDILVKSGPRSFFRRTLCTRARQRPITRFPLGEFFCFSCDNSRFRKRRRNAADVLRTRSKTDANGLLIDVESPAMAFCEFMLLLGQWNPFL